MTGAVTGRDALSVGYIGLGTMGEPMASNVVRAGFPVTVFDVAAPPLERLAALGADVARSAAELGRGCDVVLLNVVNDAQVKDVVLGASGAGGVLDSLTDGAVIVVHSTVHPSTCVQLAEVARERGVGVVDAPFTGGAAAAAAGTLSLLVGGDDTAVAAAGPVLAAEGTVHHLGTVGAGELAKLGNNLVLGITLAAVNEALAMTAAAGLDREVMLQVLTSGAADSWVARNWEAVGQMAQTYPRGAVGLAALTYKDLDLGLRVAGDVRVDMPLTRLASGMLLEPYEAALRHLEDMTSQRRSRG